MTKEPRYRWWAGETARCNRSWLQPAHSFQCEQDAEHDGPHFYRDWQWEDGIDKRDPWGNGKRRKATP